MVYRDPPDPAIRWYPVMPSHVPIWKWLAGKSGPAPQAPSASRDFLFGASEYATVLSAFVYRFLLSFTPHVDFQYKEIGTGDNDRSLKKLNGGKIHFAACPSCFPHFPGG